MESELQKFEIMCQNTKSAEDLMNITECLWNKTDFKFGTIYHKYIGWALPSEEACKIVVTFWKSYNTTFPESGIIDFGAGTGLFCKVFHHLGIPEDKLLAVELLKSSSLFCSPESLKFWPIHRDNDYIVNPDDILFIAWGVCKVESIVNDYVDRGGKCVIILGDFHGTCTVNHKMLEGKDGWIVETYKVPGPMLSFKDGLSISRRNEF